MGSRARGESGISLAELMIASVLTLVVVLMGYGILTTTSKTAAAVGDRAQNSTQARLAIDSLESDLRFANGVWLCAPLTTTPQTATTASASCPAVTSSTALVVSDDSGCTEWILTPAGTGSLSEVTLGTPTGGSFPVTPGVTWPGVKAWTNNGVQTAGFSLPLAPSQRLVQMDLTVNVQTGAAYSATNSVTVHDLIAPNNITTQDNQNVGACS